MLNYFHQSIYEGKINVAYCHELHWFCPHIYSYMHLVKHFIAFQYSDENVDLGTPNNQPVDYI